MVKLFCAIIGVVGGTFGVDIDDAESVFALKKAIKAKKPNALKDVNANNLQLFLAKKSTEWLKSTDLLRMRKRDRR
ncbi:hypothetical protein V7S43_006896 [Phytophthora oleae]|uniref:Crinkler effector protein N-terminal domain-containing protein n=1 Tax=Phytophthora oleae TaxID=2107226 RepID=A0ABD3FM89_9STRA